MRAKSIYLVLGLATVLSAGQTKMSRDLTAVQGSAPVRVILQYRTPSNQGRLRQLAARVGGVVTELPSIRSVSFSIPADQVEQLAADPQVDYITLDRPVRNMMDYTAAAASANIVRQYGWNGTGVAVAVIDSGICPSNDLRESGLPGAALLARSRIVYRESFLPLPAGGFDRYGHGTHVAGILAGNGWYSEHVPNSTRSLEGIAPGVKLVDLQVLDGNGMSSDSAVIAALGRAIELKDRYNIRVVNLSLGRPVYESYQLDPLCQAVEAAWKAGLTVVVAAGNFGRDGFPGSDGYWTITSPGNDPHVITVGAMKTEGTPERADDRIASYSSKGPTLFDAVVKPDLVAPGNHVASILADPAPVLAVQYPGNQVPAAYYGGSGASQYLWLSGTSMATPVVSGAAALLLQKDPDLTPDQVKARLMKTAGKAFPTFSTVLDPATGRAYRSQYDIFTVGAGYVDIAAALADPVRFSTA